MRIRRWAVFFAGAAACWALETAAGDWNSVLVRADRALLAHRYDEAIDSYLQGAVKAAPGDVQKTWDDLAFAYLQKKDTARAIQFGRQALEKWPDDFDLRLILAVAHVLDGDLPAAREELETIGRDISFDAGWLERTAGLVVTNELGDRLSREQLERMKREKGVLFRARPDQPATLSLDAFDERNEGAFCFYRGVVEAGLGDPERAEEMFRAAVKAGLPERDVLVGRAKAAGAIPVELRHRLKDHNNGLAWFLHEAFLKQIAEGKIVEGVNTLLNALNIEERSFEINHNLALMLLDLDDLDRAEIYGARALWLREDDSDSHELIGNIRFRQKDYSSAAYEFRRMTDIDAGDPYGHYNLGSALFMLHDAAGAETHWAKAIECEGGSPEGEAKTSTDDGKRGYSVVAKKKPVSYLARLALGKLYKEQGLADKAIPQFEAAAELKPNDAESHLSLGELYLRQGDKDRARASLERYLYLGGRDETQARRLLDMIKKRP